MNAFLWILQVLLSLHTLAGAFWKFSNTPEQAVPSLSAIPHAIWIGLSVIEIICSVMLLLPVFKKFPGKLASYAAAFITVEMVVFTIIHFTSSATEHGEVIYWLVVATLSGFIAKKRCQPVAPTV